MSRTWSVLLLVFIATFISLIYQEKLEQSLTATYETTVNAVFKSELSDPRLIWWKSSYRQWKNNPLFGYGVGNTKQAFQEDAFIYEEGKKTHWYNSKIDQYKDGRVINEFNQPHSIYFQVLVENGIFGLIAGGLLIVMTTLIGWRTAKRHPLGALALGILSVWLITGAFDAWYSQGQTLSLFWFAATIASIHPICCPKREIELNPKA